MIPGVIGTILIVLAICVAFYLVFYVFFPLGRGAIYDPSTQEETVVMADVAAVAFGEKAADLGSGDGRVVIALARRGAEAHGFEVNPILVHVARRISCWSHGEQARKEANRTNAGRGTLTAEPTAMPCLEQKTAPWLSRTFGVEAPHKPANWWSDGVQTE